MNPTVEAFDLVSERRARIALRRHRSRRGVALAVGAGLAGGLALQGGTYYRQVQQTARQEALIERLGLLAPQLAEVRDLERQLAEAAEQALARAALEPYRRGTRNLLHALGAAAQDGIAVTAISITAASASASDAEPSDDDTAAGRLSDWTRDPQEARAQLPAGSAWLEGIADDADGVARWISQLTAQHGIESVSLRALSRLEPPRHDAGDALPPATALTRPPPSSTEIVARGAGGGLLRFRVDVRLHRTPEKTQS